MSGCFGSSKEDKIRENEMLDHTDEDRKEVREEELIIYVCPYCELNYEYEYQAAHCRDLCFSRD